MNKKIAKVIGAGMIVLALAGASSGLAHADAVPPAYSSGGQTCYEYVDTYGHIYTVCNAPDGSGGLTSPASNEAPAQAGQTRILMRFHSTIW